MNILDTQVVITLELSNTSVFPLEFEVWLDNTKFFDGPITQQPQSISYNFEDNESNHQLKLVLKNKQRGHTKVDAQGSILSDALVNIKNICIDDIAIDQIVYDQARYIHNTNNTTDTVHDQFYGSMGCNGEVVFDFYSPFYMWLLENM